MKGVIADQTPFLLSEDLGKLRKAKVVLKPTYFAGKALFMMSGHVKT
jgi:hypothetical protein